MISFKKNLQGLVTAVALAGGLAPTASAADFVSCTAGGCECRFTWGTTNKVCPPPTTTSNFKADQCSSNTSLVAPNNYTVQVSLVKGVSSSNIPINAAGQLFEEFCRASDSTKNGNPATRGCKSTAFGAPTQQRILVG